MLQIYGNLRVCMPWSLPVPPVYLFLPLTVSLSGSSCVCVSGGCGVSLIPTGGGSHLRCIRDDWQFFLQDFPHSPTDRFAYQSGGIRCSHRMSAILFIIHPSFLIFLKPLCLPVLLIEFSLEVWRNICFTLASSFSLLNTVLLFNIQKHWGTGHRTWYHMIMHKMQG